MRLKTGSKPIMWRRMLLLLAFEMVLLMLGGARWQAKPVLALSPRTDEIDCGQGNPPPCKVWMPHIVTYQPGGIWRAVAGYPKELEYERFFSVAVCGDRKLAGSNVGVFSLEKDEAIWKHEKAILVENGQTDVAFVPGDCSRAYAASISHGVYAGKNEQNSWKWTRVDQNDQLKGVRSILVDSTTVYAAGSFGVRRASPLPTVAQAWQGDAIDVLTTSVTLETDSSPNVLATVWNEGVRIRIGSAIWAPLPPVGELEDKLVYSVAYDGEQGVLGTQSGLFNWEQGQWKRVASINTTAFSVALGMELPNGNRVLYTGARTSGVQTSVDGGKSWIPMMNGMSMPVGTEFQVRDLHMGGDGKLYAATTSGVWVWSGRP